jgi:hypothetical protein
MLVVWFATFGLFAAFDPRLIAHSNALFPPHQVGRGLTGLNMGSMGGKSWSKIVSGFLIGLFPTASDGGYVLDAYRWAVGLQGAFILLGYLAYFGSPDPAQRRRSPAPDAWKGVGDAWKKVNTTYFSTCALCAAVYLIAVR